MLPTIKSDSIYPLPNDVAIFNINIVDIIVLIGIICLIIKRKSIFNANNDVLDKYNGIIDNNTPLVYLYKRNNST